jgi:hypothetical protein
VDELALYPLPDPTVRQTTDFIALNFPNYLYVFQDAVAPVNRARIVESYQHEKHINGIVWPAQSPDI